MTTNTEGGTRVPINSFSLFFTYHWSQHFNYSMHCIKRYAQNVRFIQLFILWRSTKTRANVTKI